MPEQFCTFPINQRTANFLGLPSCQTNQLYRERQRTPDLQVGRVHRPCHLRQSGRLQQLLNVCRQSRLHELPPSTHRKTKDRRQKDGPFDNLDRPPEDMNHDQSKKVITANVVPADISASRTATPLKGGSVNSAPGILPPLRSGAPFECFYAVDLAYDKILHEVGSFFCRSTYCVWISIGIQEKSLWTVASLLDTGAGPDLTNRSFYLDYCTIKIS